MRRERAEKEDGEKEEEERKGVKNTPNSSTSYLFVEFSVADLSSNHTAKNAIP